MSFYIIKTDQQNPRHHGLHTNNSPYVITTDPSPGDEIVYVLPFSVRRQYDESGQICGGHAQIDCSSYLKENQSDSVRLRILSHLGRASFMGEDGTEDAFGHDMLVTLFLEVLRGCDWSYCPIDVEIVPKPEHSSDKLSQEYDSYVLWCRSHLNFAYGPGKGWQLEDPNQEEVLRESRSERLSEYLLNEFRLQCKALSDDHFEILKQQVLLETDDQEWINREPGREWAWNPVACTLHTLTKAQAHYSFNAQQATVFVQQQIIQRIGR
ncbi:MAG: hypothetical protein MH252_07610 [Thermosynechococcaceae cyanobacterium MS004]|nr:hypothetical protein [Thermosynechococcaceae cyanobacterium MS004]